MEDEVGRRVRGEARPPPLSRRPLLAPPHPRTALPPLRPAPRALSRDVAKIAIPHRAESRRRQRGVTLAGGGGRVDTSHRATHALLAALRP